MKPKDGTPPDETLAESRAWAAGLCEALEQSVSCYDYWDRVRVETAGWSQWRIYKRYGCFGIGLKQRWVSAFEAYMETPLHRFLKK